MLQLYMPVNLKSNYTLEMLHEIKDSLSIFENYDSFKALLELRCQIFAMRNLFSCISNDFDLTIQLCTKSDACHFDIDGKINFMGWSWQHMRLLLFMLRKMANNLMPYFHTLNKCTRN